MSRLEAARALLERAADEAFDPGPFGTKIYAWLAACRELRAAKAALVTGKEDEPITLPDVNLAAKRRP